METLDDDDKPSTDKPSKNETANVVACPRGDKGRPRAVQPRNQGKAIRYGWLTSTRPTTRFCGTVANR